MENFCLACIATPIAFLVSTNSNNKIEKNTLNFKEIEKQRRREKLVIYLSILFLIVSTIFTIYLMNGGCEECK
jgi:hypothetical protein